MRIIRRIVSSPFKYIGIVIFSIGMVLLVIASSIRNGNEYTENAMQRILGKMTVDQ